MVSVWHALWAFCAGGVVGFFLYGSISEKEDNIGGLKEEIAELNVWVSLYRDEAEALKVENAFYAEGIDDLVEHNRKLLKMLNSKSAR